MSNTYDLGIIGAMEVEVEELIKQMENHSTKEFAGRVYHLGTIGKTNVVVCKALIGKVNAALTTQVMIDHFAPEYIVNVGVAGAVSLDLKIGDFVVADTVCYHDFYCGEPYSMGEVPDTGKDFHTDATLSDALVHILEQEDESFNVAHGLIVSGDQFIDDPERTRQLREDFGALACEMEGAAIGHVCSQNGVPFAVIRSMSDEAGNAPIVDWDTFAKREAHVAADILSKFCKSTFFYE